MEEGERKCVKPDSEKTISASCSSTTSAQEQGPKTDRKAAGDEADSTDVYSDKFDPLAALYSPNVRLPVPNIKCFNNVAEYESFLKGGRGRAKPENVEKRRLKAMKGVADPERIERLKKLMVNNPVEESEEGKSSGTTRRRRRETHKNVLTRMTLCRGSPLGELYRCVEERIRVKVHIRTFKGLRGVCSGFVMAFDKFWNMAMVDVDETYREPLLGEALYHEKALTVSRLFEKLNIQENPRGDGPAKQQDTQDKNNTYQPGDPRTTHKGSSAQPASVRGNSRTAESELSDAVKQDEHTVTLKAQDPQAHQKKDSQRYGKVHTRHVNQLFIRGENIILVNLQPL